MRHGMMDQNQNTHTEENHEWGQPKGLPSGCHEESRSLWEEVFPEDGKAFLDAYYAGKGRNNEILVIRDEKSRICAMIHWNPVNVFLYGKERTADFLVAVATRADMRRKGLMARLMHSGLKERMKRRVPFVFLNPAVEAYYTPFDFVSVGACLACKASGIGVFRKTEFEVRPVLSNEYEGAAAWVNGQLEKRYSLFALRSAEYFCVLSKELASEGGQIMGVYENAEMKGLFLYTLEGGLEIREPVCHPEREEEILGAVRKWASDSFGADLLENAEITGCGPEREHTYEKLKLMIRIVSLEECIRCLPAKENFQQQIRVHDPILAENNGLFFLTVSPEGNRLRPAEEETEDCVELSIRELTGLLFSRIFLNEVV